MLNGAALADEVKRLKVAAIRAEILRRQNYRIDQYFPETGPLRRELYAKQMELFAAGATFKERLFMAANRIGKAQPVSEPVLTPTGFAAMGSLRVGDRVIGSDGQPTSVTAVYPQGVRRIVTVTCSDGSSTRCDVDHLWSVRPVSKGHRSKFVVMTAGELRRHVDAGERWMLPARPVVALEQRAELPVDPYLIGLLLGDGGLSGSGVFITSADDSIVAYCREMARQFDCELRPSGPMGYYFGTTIKRSGRWVNLLRNALDGLGMAGKGAYEKRIPLPYLLGDADTRLAVLQGLMDTDGSCSKQTGARLFYSVSRDLCKDVAFLARSLGMNAKVSPKNGRYKGAHHASWLTLIAKAPQSVFRLSRKRANETAPAIAERGVVVESIADAGEEECQCIVVAAPDHLYVTQGFILTHNSEAGAYETTCHLTGLYPDWWVGRRFDTAIQAWAAGTNSQTTRDIVQAKLLGPVDALKTGMIPAHLIVNMVAQRGGVAGAMETVWVRHVSGGVSVLGFKTYEQGRASFEGTEKHLIWNDEEPPLDVYTEELYRTATTKGIVLTTFTPLQGMSEVVKSFIEPENELSAEFKVYIQAGWKDVPHLDESEKRALIATTPPYQVLARTEGEPVLGAGAIYPIAEADITSDLLVIPDSWIRVFGMDVGWNRTAVVWGAKDPGNGTIHLYDEYYQGGQSEETVATHSLGIRRRGDWIPGTIDPAARGRSQIDGRRLLDLYTTPVKKGGGGLDLTPADNAVETGIAAVWELMVSGGLKVMPHLGHWFREFRKYHRDEKGLGKIVKKNDHLMDATRYLIVTGVPLMKLKPKEKEPEKARLIDQGSAGLGWLGN